MKMRKSLRIVLEIAGNLFRRVLTVRFPEQSLELPEAYRGEHVLDTEKCKGCGLCADICSSKAIRMVETAEGKRPEIDASKCCYCGLCEDVCPANALRLTRHLSESVRDPSDLVKRPKEVKEKSK